MYTLARHYHTSIGFYQFIKEMLAIFAALKKWNSYLTGRHFQIKTDHYTFKFVLDQKATTPTQQAWLVKMMSYDFEVSFKKGFSNTMANALSRKPQGSFHAISTVTNCLLQQIKHSWIGDASLVHLIHKLSASPATPFKYE